MANLWTSAEHALSYLEQADKIPHRTEGEAVLLEKVPKTARHILNLGTGDGGLLARLKIERPAVSCVAVDFSPTMLEAVKTRFRYDSTIEIIDHNLDEILPELGTFNAVISSFAIPHLSHNRKPSLYVQIFNNFRDGGILWNLKHVASPTLRLREKFLTAIGRTPSQDDPSNQLLEVETQLKWLRKIGFEDMHCYWKCLELALLIALKPKLQPATRCSE